MLPLSAKVLILVPAAEVQELFTEIYQTLNVKVQFPLLQEESGFLLDFSEEGDRRPRYLGRLDAERTLEMLQAEIPKSSLVEVKDSEMFNSRSFAAFKAKIEAAENAGKRKSKSAKEKKKQSRILEKRNIYQQLRRTQCYLGIRPRDEVLKDPHHLPNLDWNELQEARKTHENTLAESRKEIDVTKAVPHVFHHNVVFVSVDVESFERNHRQVTEIGVSTLDVNDLVNLPPGDGGVAWMSQIRARHFRIKEHSHLVNSEFIAGCPDGFQKEFGTSEWISILEAPHVVASCFRAAYSDPTAVVANGPGNSRVEENPKDAGAEDTEGSWDHEPTSAGEIDVEAKAHDLQPKRNIVLVGHDTKTDMDYLRLLGYDVRNLPSVLEAVDTRDLYRALQHEQQPRNLGAVLMDLGISGWGLHNAVSVAFARSCSFRASFVCL